MSPASHVVSRLRKLYGLVLSNTRVLCQERMHPRCRTLGLAGGVAVEPLEPRLLLSVAASGQAAPYLPPQHFLAESNGYLTEPSSGRPLDIAMQYLTSHAGLLGCGAGDIQQSIVTDQYVSADTGVTHIYLRQQYDGMDIVNANLCVNVTADGRLLNVGGGFVNGVNAAPAVLLASAGPRLSPDQAIAKAAEALNLTSSGAAMALDAASPATLSEASLSLDPIPTKLEYIATPQGLSLAWDLVIRTTDHEHWYDVGMDASAGQCLSVSDWVDHASYRVFALPAENPDDAGRTLVVDPADAVASPYGWHDTNGAAGPEYTDTRGNNVWAQEDQDANNAGGFRPNGTSSLTFDFPLNLSQEPTSYQSAAITNLFYWNNLLHDIHYRYGFDEAAGNFQMTNYSGAGLGGDAVMADAQDGEYINNANFATPPDGQSPRMQMFNWDDSFPNRDGDLESTIIAHEYGHGVSNRLVGGPANAGALDAIQSGGMGEGWGDWWALMFTMKPTDAKTGAYTLGAYSLDDSAGLRRYPYSFDKAIDPLTYGSYNDSDEVHDAGEIWCTALWDMTWLLIDAHGFSADIANGYDPAVPASAGGNNLALQLVMDSLKLLPANPTFLDGRDAILQADEVLTGGVNQPAIWAAFARRGMGVGATDGGGPDATVVTESFEDPWPDPVVLSATPDGVAMAPLIWIRFHFNKPIDPGSFDLASDVVSFTGPDGTDLRSQVTGFEWLDNQTLRVDVEPQTTLGTYAMCIGPEILAADDGHAMDQDRDGTLGEVLDDAFTASINLVEGPQTLYSANMDADPLWSLQGQWAWGQPQGQGGDPTSGHTGSNVIGYNLNGRYSDSMGMESATTPTFSTLGCDNIHLGFWRQLGVEDYYCDYASICVWNGSYWSTLWDNDVDGSISDDGWVYQEYVLPDSASDQPAVAIAWKMGPTDGSVTYCGWNIDDVVVTGAPMPPDLAGPAVEWSTPSDTLVGSQKSVAFSFYEAMDTSSFDVADDVVSFTGPRGEDLKGQITGFAWIDAYTLEVRFSVQSQLGTYSMVIGPQITDDSWNPMNQDGDDINGELPDDCYNGTFTILRDPASSLVGIDFDEYDGTCPPNWNLVDGAWSPGDLTDDTGEWTPFYLDISSSTDNASTYPSTPDPATLPAYAHSLSGLDGYLFESGSPETGLPVWTFTWTGLSPGSTYDVYLFGLRAFGGSNSVTITGTDAPINFTQTLEPNMLQVNGEQGSDGRSLSSYADLMTADADGTIVITITPGPNSTAVALAGMAIQLQAGRIEGDVSYDVNNNGVRESDEAPLAERTVYLDINGNGTWDDDEPSQDTDSAGHYVFLGVPAGTYDVREAPQDDWTQTYPADGLHTVVLGVGQSVTGQDFGDYIAPGQIEGSVWNDFNGDGLPGADEQMLPGQAVYLDANYNGQWDPGESSQVTDASGRYVFAGLMPGDYQVYQQLQPGWMQVYPRGVSTPQWVTVEPGQVVSGIDFGDQQLSRIEGDVWNDLNGDGVRDAGEPGLADVPVCLDGSRPRDVTLTIHSTETPRTVPSWGWIASYLTVPDGCDLVYDMNVTLSIASANDSNITVYLCSPEGPWIALFDGVGDSGQNFTNTTLDDEAATSIVEAAAPFTGSFRPEYALSFFDGESPVGEWCLEVDASSYDPSNVLLSWSIQLTTESSESVVTTDETGHYAFADVPAGDYTVSVPMDDTWTQTVPGGEGTRSVSPKPGEVVTGQDFGNHQLPGQIEGCVWNDFFGDGYGWNEPNLAGWTVYLDSNNNGAPDQGEPTQVTDDSGHYVFADLQPGTYTVMVASQSGWTQTYPFETYSVVVGAGDDLSGYDFGVCQQPGQIEGNLWNDKNGNGVRDAGEPGLVGWVIDAFGYNGAETYAYTNTTGHYVLSDLPPGTYIVSQCGGDGWTQTLPQGDGTYTVAIASGQVVTGQDFGLQELPGQLEGDVWNDLDADGWRDAGESAVSGWTVYLDANGNGHLDANELSQVSDAAGHYILADLSSGPYNVRAIVPQDWVQTRPTGNGAYSGTLDSGDDGTGLDFGVRQRPGQIEGDVWYDVNSDGQRETGDYGISAQVFLDANDNGTLDSGEVWVWTNSNYHYVLSNVPAGTYKVRQKLASGYTQTCPLDNAARAVTVSCGQAVTGQDFGVYALPGRIEGDVWSDMDGDAWRDTGEPTLAGWTVYLDANSNGQLDLGETSQLSNASGHFVFDNLPAGVRYVVREVVQAGWVQTLPLANGPYALTLSAGQVSTGNNFGNHATPGMIEGDVWNDANGDGVRDPSELSLAWQVFADINGNGQLDGAEPSASTDPYGHYVLSYISPGAYAVREVHQVEWRQTYPSDDSAQLVSVAPGQHLTGVNFGEQRMPGPLSGEVWNDVNGDSIRNSGEPFLSGWTVYLDTNVNGQLDAGEPTQTTDGAGRYAFSGLVEGTYVVSVNVQAGWGQTLPGNGGARTVTVVCGQSAFGNSFGFINTPLAPSTPDLTFESDRGLYHDDNITNLNNSSFMKTLYFAAQGTIPGATVNLYADGALWLDSAVAQGQDVLFRTDGVSVLTEGVHQITARQTLPGSLQSRDSVALSVTIDTLRPVVTVDSLMTANQQPALTGTVDDPNAAIGVTIGDTFYAAINNGNGTWRLPAGTIDPLAAEGTYDVAVSAIDVAGNEGTDGTRNELRVLWAGDANGDGAVTFRDYIIVEAHFGKTDMSWADGDFNGDRKVDFRDYVALEGNFGKSASIPAPAFVPLAAALPAGMPAATIAPDRVQSIQAKTVALIGWGAKPARSARTPRLVWQADSAIARNLLALDRLI